MMSIVSNEILKQNHSKASLMQVIKEIKIEKLKKLMKKAIEKIENEHIEFDQMIQKKEESRNLKKAETEINIKNKINKLAKS